MQLVLRHSVLAAVLSAGLLAVPASASPPELGGASILDRSTSQTVEIALDDALGFEDQVEDQLFDDIEFDELEFRNTFDEHEIREPGSSAPAPKQTVSTQEKIQERYPNGTIHIERWVSLDPSGNFVNHGPWKQFDREGQLIKSGSWELGLREGEWFQTLDGDQVSRLSTNVKGFQAPFTSTAIFKDGQLDGSWVITDRSNKKVVSWDYAYGQRTGISLWFTTSGSKRLRIDYIDNQPSGAMLVWSGLDSGPPKQYGLVRGMEVKTETKWHSKTKRQKEEQFTFLVPSTMQIASQSWDDSYLKYKQSSNVPPLRHGECVRWYRNGVMAHKGSYDFGKPSGDAQWWHANGQRQVVGKYVDGHPSGQWVWWHANGMRKISGEYYAGKQVGLWRSWSEQGELAAVEQKPDVEQVIASEKPSLEEPYTEAHGDRISTLARPTIR